MHNVSPTATTKMKKLQLISYKGGRGNQKQFRENENKEEKGIGIDGPMDVREEASSLTLNIPIITLHRTAYLVGDICQNSLNTVLKVSEFYHA